MSLQRPSFPSADTPGVGVRAISTPQQLPVSRVFLPSAVPSATSIRSSSALPHLSRRQPLERASTRLPASPQNSKLSMTPPPQLATVSRAAATSGLAYLAPHSPAVTRASLGASPRLHSASMRGTPAAQRMHSASYSARPSHGSLSMTAVVTATTKAHGFTTSPSRPSDTASARSSPQLSAAVDSPVYYVVGGAVVNPQLTVSPSVQGGIRGVKTLTTPPDAVRRPEIGPQLYDTHTAGATPTAAHPTTTPQAGNSDDDRDAVVRVEAIRSARPTTTADANTNVQQQPQDVRAGSLAVLRQLYGTTAEDVNETAQANPRSGALEPPRMQYYTAQELLPELASTEAQLKAMASARRRIDWDVCIPTAATLPPPTISFTTVHGTPVPTLSLVHLEVDTSTLVMQRDYAAEKAMMVHTGSVNHPSPLSETENSATTAAAVKVTPALSAASRTSGVNKNAASQGEEEKVGLDVSREDRIGSSGLYRIRHLVGLRQGLGEMVGLDRVMEYEVATTSSKLFLVQPSIDANSGDLLMELNTSLQGTAKLVITGVDCGSIDAETGDVQRSLNTLTCYVTLKQSTIAAAATLRDRSLVSMSISGGGSPQYACVPSASTRSPSAGNRIGNGSGGSGGVAPFPGSANTSHNHSGNDPAAASDGFALSLAHFSQEFAAADRPASRSLSLSRDAAAGGVSGGSHQENDTSRRHNLDVQGVVARTAALAELCGGGSGGSPVSGAYANTGRRATSGGGAGQRPRMSVSSRDGSSGGISGAGAHYIFALTNPHDLRYRHVTEAVRLCRLQHLTRLQETEAQRRRETLPPAAPKPSVTNVPSSNAMSGRGKDNRRGEAVRYNSVVNHASWSDDEDDEGDKDTTREPSEASQSRSQESAGTIASGAAAAEKKRSCRKSVVEILELEEEFDQHNPVAIPTMMSHRSSQSARRVPSSQRLRSEPHASEASLNNLPSACPNAPDSGAARELRRPRMPSTLFCMNTMQSPVSYLRLTVWQDRLLLLFTEDDKELLRSDQRLRFKREARQELTEGSLAGMLGSTFAWSTNPGSSTSIGGRKLSMQSRRSSCVLNPRNFSLAGSAGGESAHDGGSGSNSSSPFSNLLNKNNGATNRPTSGGGHGAYNAAERPFSIIRRLILCLALEEERSSVQLYADVVQLCSHLCHSALLKTIALTRGTRNGLQQAAAAVLASGSPTPFPKAKAGCYATPVWEGNSTFSASDRESLRLLSDALELAMTVTLLIGAYGDAVEYALQRVHALCLLEGDTTAVVNAAQRDLVEAYLFHGDYATAVTIAEDVVMLTERLCLGDPGAYEVAEAEALCALACVSAGRRDRLTHYITRLELNVMPIGDGPNGTTATPLPLLQAQLRLVLSFAKMNLAGAAADVVALLREAVHLLRGDGDLQEIEQSFSTVFPSQTRLMANMESSNTSMPLSVRGRLASMASCSITAGPMMDNRSTAELNGSDGAVKMMAAQKRLRWNMLSFAGALLVENDETEEGIEVMESTVKELVLGQHRYVEHYHRSSIAALLWVGLLLLKSWAQPTSKEDFASMLKEVANRVVRLKGPLHPFAAAVNLQYANVAHHSLNSRHGLNLVSRSLSVLENAMSPQSHYLLMAHYVLGSMAESQQRWRPALEHLSAAYAIAQATHLCERDLLPLVTRFLGALLNCPTTAAVDVDMTTLRSQVEGHLTTVRHSAGPQSDALVEPLWNMAEVYYLLKQPADAVACLQQAVQLLDRRGVLLASADVLKPVDILRLEHQYQQQRDVNVGRGGGDADSKSIQQVVQERNAVVQASFDSVEQALWLANTLYMLGAMFEAQARTAEAQEKYAQCLAVFEAVQLGSDSLPAAHVMMAMAKLLYTEANCGDALRWAHKAELLLHLHYRKQWPLELESAEKLVAVVEQRLYEDEGTYVAQSDLSTQDGLPWLL